MKSYLAHCLSVLFVFVLFASTPAFAQNLALNKTATASSQVQAAANAFDGNGTTRWESATSDPQYITVDLGSVQTIDRIRLTWEDAYAKNFTLDVSSDNSTWKTVVTVTNNATTANEYTNLKTKGRYVRMNGTARATTYSYSLYEFEVFSSSNNAVNLAAGKASASSTMQGGFPASAAFDSDNSTRWGSAYADNQWLYVDLGSQTQVSRIYLIWQTAYGKDFRMEISDDANTWTTLTTVTGNTLHYSDLTVSGTGRYVRMYGVTRGTGYGFSLYEMQVNGTATPLPVTLTSFTAAPKGTGVAVNWTTASEQNTASFEVQRSANGTDFTALTSVAAAGNSQATKTYQYVDAAPLRSASYYRLKQIDADGTFTYSPVVAVQATTASAAVAFSLYPNPTADQATIQWEASATSTGHWTLMSTTGQVVHTEALTAQQGYNAQVIDLRPYAAGSYLLTLETAGQTLSRTRVQKVN